MAEKRTDLEEHQLRFNALKATKSPFEADFQEIQRMIMPFAGDITTRHNEGQRRIDGVFDTTGVTAADLLVNFVMANMLPSSSPWLTFTPPPQHADNPAVMKPLQDAAGELLNAYGNSNFYVEMAHTVQSFLIIGNSCVGQHISRRGSDVTLKFDAIPMGDVWWQIGSDRVVNMIYRRVMMSCIDAYVFFTKTKKLDDSVFPTWFMEMLRGPRKMEKVELIHSVYENEDTVPGGLKTPRTNRWLCDWMVEGQSGLDMISQEEGFEVSPYVASRLMVVNREEYGRGRGHIVRPDLLRLNRIKQLGLLAISRELLPTLLIEDQSVLQLTGRPGGTAIFRPNSTPPSFLRPGSDHLQADSIANLEREQVRKGLLTDVLEEKETESRSATESIRRDQSILRRMHSPTNVMRRELIDPTIQGSVELLRGEGRLRSIDEAYEAAGEPFPLGIKLISPFFAALSQGQLGQIESYVDRLTQRAQILGDPGVLDPVDLDEVAYAEAELGEVPARILKDREQMAQERQQREELAARAEAREEAAAVAQLNGSVGSGQSIPN